MTREDVAAIVATCIRDILFEVDDEQIRSARSLKDLGANSLDRVEIASLSMDKLGLSFPLSQLSTVSTIDGLIDALFEKLPR